MLHGPSFSPSMQLPESNSFCLEIDSQAHLPASAGLVDALLQKHDEKLTATLEDGFKRLQELLGPKSPLGVVEVPKVMKVKKRSRGSGTSARESLTSGGSDQSNVSKTSVAEAQDILKDTSKRQSLVDLGSMEETEGRTWPCVHHLRQWIPAEGAPPGNPISRMTRPLVDSWRFETFFAAVIATNSLFIAVQVSWAAQQPGRPSDVGMFYVSSLYSLLFTVELLLRLMSAGPRLYCGQDWAWTLLDTLVVATSILEFIVELQAHQEPDNGANLMGNMRFIRILRIAKITRAIRIVRLVKVVRALRSLLFCIGRTLRAMAWSAALLALIIFLFGLVFTDVATEYFANPEEQLSQTTTDFLQLRFSSLEGSMHTLFASITGGFTWVEARDAFGEISFFWGFLFEAYISFCLFAVLNVMTGVFCQSAIESAEKDHELNLQMLAQERAKYFRAVKRLFAQLDKNQDGGITVKEFEVALQDPALMHVFDALEISSDDAWALFTQLDSDGDAHVDADEFLEGCMLLKGPARSVDVMGIKRDVAIVKQRLEQQVSALMSRSQFSGGGT